MAARVVFPGTVVEGEGYDLFASCIGVGALIDAVFAFFLRFDDDLLARGFAGFDNGKTLRALRGDGVNGTVAQFCSVRADGFIFRSGRLFRIDSVEEREHVSVGKGCGGVGCFLAVDGCRERRSAALRDDLPGYIDEVSRCDGGSAFVENCLQGALSLDFQGGAIDGYGDGHYALERGKAENADGDKSRCSCGYEKTPRNAWIEKRPLVPKRLISLGRRVGGMLLAF